METDIFITGYYDKDNDPTMHKQIELSEEEFILSSKESLDREDSGSYYKDKHRHHKDDKLTKNKSRMDDESGINKEDRHQDVNKDDASEFDTQTTKKDRSTKFKKIKKNTKMIII